MQGLSENSYVEQIISEQASCDQYYLRQNRLLVALILILDEGKDDYVIQLLIESVQDGLLNSVMYTIANAFHQFNLSYSHQV